jgi:hypothetical protein
MRAFIQQTVPNATWVSPVATGGGASAPRTCDFDDKVLRHVKWHPSNHGLTSTYSELVASRIGLLFGAPVLRGVVVYVAMEKLPSEIKARVSQPYHLGFVYSPGKDFVEDDYKSIRNTAALPAAAVLLTWLQVGDQVGHNQYLFQLERVFPDKTTEKMNDFLLIDLAAICGVHDWSGHPLDGYDLQLMSWGDGSGVPTSGNRLVLVGTDTAGMLHIRIFDAAGNRVTDTDETKLPGKAGPISTLKQQLPGLLPPHVLTGAEKAPVLQELTSILGQTPLDNAGSAYDLPPIIKARVKFDQIEPIVKKIMEMPEDDIRKCLTDYPQDWNIQKDRTDKLGDFIIERRGEVEEILKSQLV